MCVNCKMQMWYVCRRILYETAFAIIFENKCVFLLSFKQTVVHIMPQYHILASFCYSLYVVLSFRESSGLLNLCESLINYFCLIKYVLSYIWGESNLLMHYTNSE